MTKHQKISRIFHCVTLCCFLLPFFYTGCRQNAEENATYSKEIQDSIEFKANHTSPYTQDSVSEQTGDTITDTVSTQLSETTVSNSKSESFTPSQDISKKYMFLRPFLVSKEKTFSGIAIIIDSVLIIPYFAVFISFLILLIGLTIKFIDRNARKGIVLLDFLSLIFLFFSQPYSLISEKLWGFWIAIIFILVLTVYDIVSIRLDKHLKDKLNEDK
jgi:hypothetical protein